MSKERILVVDDEQHIQDVIVYVLEEAGFIVMSAMDGDSALEMFKTDTPDLVVLDLMLPGIPGRDLFTLMRGVNDKVPVIMVTSLSDEIDRVAGLELGADDYVTKPFSARELTARVQAVLRRTSNSDAGKENPALSVNADTMSVSYFNKAVNVTKAEFNLISSLSRYPAKVFTRNELINLMYSEEHIVTDRSVDACVKRLRKKFALITPDFDPLQTVHGIGYKLRQTGENF